MGGLVSGALNRRSETRESRRQQLSGLLCDLLELRHRIIGLSEIRKALTPLLPDHIDQLTVALPAIMETVASPSKLHEHYEAAIIELAVVDPLLAFQLRSKNLADAAMSPLSKIASQEPTGIPHAAQAFQMLGELGTTALDEAILRIAKELGRLMHRKTQTILETKSELPDGIKQILALVPSALQAAQQQAQAHAPTAQSAPTQPTAQSAKANG